MTVAIEPFLSKILSANADLDEMSDLLSELVPRYGADHFLIGCGAFAKDSEFLGVQFLTSMNSEFMLEYDQMGYETADLVVEVADGLTTTRQNGVISYGRHIANDNAYRADTQKFYGRTADYGFGTGVAYVSREFKGDVQHGFAFNFGTVRDNDTNGLDAISKNRNELLILASAVAPHMRPSLARKLNGLEEVRLSGAEIDVLAAYVRGGRAKTIANAMGLTPRTVTFHAQNIRRKLKAQTMAEAVAIAYRIGIL